MSRRKHPDAALLRCCAKMESAQAAAEAMEAESREGRSTPSPERDAHFEAIRLCWWQGFERAARLPALTPEGIRAKARMVQMLRKVHGDDTDLGRFLDSFLADLLPPAADPAEPPSVGELVLEGRRIAASVLGTAATLKPKQRAPGIRTIAAELVRHLIEAEPHCALSIASAATLAHADALTRAGPPA